MKSIKDESGQVMALTVLSMFLLLACIALAVDVGLLFRVRRQVQIAADAAAIAAALEYHYHGSTNAASVGVTAGSQDGVAASDVHIVIGPTDGYHTGPGYVEAGVIHPNPTVFLSLFGFSTVNVGARAVAGITPAPSCMTALDTRTGLKSASLWVKGNATVKATNCGITVNNPSTSAFCDQGSATIQAPYIHLNGSQSTSGQCAKAPGSDVISGTGTVPDPYHNLTGPVPTLPIPNNNAGSKCTTSNTYTSTSLTSVASLPTPQAAADGIASDRITCFTGSNVSLSNVTLPAGIYVFTNGVNIGSNVVAGDKNNMATGGATLDIYQGTFNDQNGTLTVYAPANTSATYNSIAIMQPSSNTTGQCQDNSISNKINTSTCLQVQFGSQGEDLEGIIYAPTATVYLQDQGGLPMTAAGIISDDIYINSQINITNNYSDTFSATTPLSQVELVE